MKLYTKRGDSGETDLLGGDRVGKDHLRVEAYGDVDELNAAIGAAGAASRQEDIRSALQPIQSALFDLGSRLASPSDAHADKMGLPHIADEDIAGLEKLIDGHEASLEPLKNFILPGGSPAAAAFHLARTACRRAERRAVGLDRMEPVDPRLLRYLNRLSDLLFVLARVENQRAGVADVEWIGRER